jgi:hypothetical protein
LDDGWLKRNAASLMGKTDGKVKARTNAKQAAQARWDKERAKQKRRTESSEIPS